MMSRDLFQDVFSCKELAFVMLGLTFGRHMDTMSHSKGQS